MVGIFCIKPCFLRYENGMETKLRDSPCYPSQSPNTLTPPLMGRRKVHDQKGVSFSFFLNYLNEF
ncbi:hypothetical protein HanRHA438_Chr05g0216121 [Helianthus annuus]|nr:hypothetical protein HanRHA438_Chr05g0216121 [Helianthus annuus]